MSSDYSETYTGSNFDEGGGFGGVIEDNKTKIVLLHKTVLKIWRIIQN